MKIIYYCDHCKRIFGKQIPCCEINKETTGCAYCGHTSKMEASLMTKFEVCKEQFNKIRELCIEAYKDGIITDEDFFIRNGIPQWFMRECKVSHLYGGGKKNQNIFWNWHQNKKYPTKTIDNFLEYLESEEEQQ